MVLFDYNVIEKQKGGNDYMTITRKLNGKEITEDDLKNIEIKDEVLIELLQNIMSRTTD